MKKNAPYGVKQILPEVYALNLGTVCTYLVVGKTHALVLDTGCGFADPMPQIRVLTDNPLIVVNTHGHYDHSGGNSFFEGPVYIHELEVEVHNFHNGPQIRQAGLDILKRFQKILFFMNILPKGLDEQAYVHAPLFADFRFIKEGDQFDLGGLTAKVVEIPGHTVGGIGILIPEKRLFFAGDGINGGTWLYLRESAKLPVYLESLYKADALDFDWMLTGHSSKLVFKAALKEYIAVAENPDFEGGRVQKESPYAPGVIPRVCHAKGSKGGASIMISKENLK